MADITMCVGDNCLRKEICYRYTAKINEYRQAFFSGTPPLEADGSCSQYSPNEKALTETKGL